MSEEKILGVVEAAYAKSVMFALRPRVEGDVEYIPEPETWRKKILRVRWEVRYGKMQRLHDWTEKKGAHCHDNY